MTLDQMCVLPLQKHPGIKEEDEPEEEEEEELGHAETYAEYMPMKRKCILCLICMFHSELLPLSLYKIVLK